MSDYPPKKLDFALYKEFKGARGDELTLLTSDLCNIQ